MTKAVLATLIMTNIDGYKKSHLAKMHLIDLECIATPFLLDETPISDTETKVASTVMGATITESEAFTHTEIPDSTETA